LGFNTELLGHSALSPRPTELYRLASTIGRWDSAENRSRTFESWSKQKELAVPYELDAAKQLQSHQRLQVFVMGRVLTPGASITESEWLSASMQLDLGQLKLKALKNASEQRNAAAGI